MSNNLPQALYRAEQVRELDRLARQALGIDEFELMRRAGAAALSRLRKRWRRAGSLLVLAGAGNNGGDGYVIAALAADLGLRVQLVHLSNPDQLGGAAAQAWRMAVENNVPMCSFPEFKSRQWRDFELVVDALFGTGLNRAAEGEWLEAIKWINASGLPVLAVDIPSGLDADTGTPMGAAVRARMTVTFIGMKRGLLTRTGPDCTGELIFEDLDAPPRIHGADASTTAEVKRIDINHSAGFLPPREPSSHKGGNGHVLLLGGDHGMGGAIILAAEAALRSGAGLVSVVTRSAHRPAVLARRPEIMVAGTEDGRVDLPALFDRASNIVIGPGLGLGEWSRNLLRAALGGHATRGLPLVADADALRLLAQKAAPETDFPRRDWVLTPHPGEAAALLGIDLEEVQRDRFAAVDALRRRYDGHCLLKGAGSLICAPGHSPRLKLCTEGNPGMASAGMGDVLSGIIAGLHAQGLSLEDSLSCAVCVHGEAADLAAAEAGERGLIATDLMPFIRQLVNPQRSR